MSGRTWVISDTHFGHAGVCRFLRADGTKLRPWDDPDEMDEVLVKNWNEVVEDKDRVYHLGDVVINRRCLKTLGRLKGRLCLIKGNHDIFRLSDYLPYFDDIRAYNVIKYEGSNVIMSHIPVHQDQLRRFALNIHGHTHSNFVMKGDVRDPQYVNVCVEQLDYRPKLLQELLKEHYVSEPPRPKQVLDNRP